MEGERPAASLLSWGARAAAALLRGRHPFPAGLHGSERNGDWHVLADGIDARFRGRGYATSTVSEFVKWIHEKVPVALIHVKAGNTLAEKAYYGVGFKRQRSFMIHKLAP